MRLASWGVIRVILRLAVSLVPSRMWSNTGWVTPGCLPKMLVAGRGSVHWQTCCGLTAWRSGCCRRASLWRWPAQSSAGKYPGAGCVSVGRAIPLRLRRAVRDAVKPSAWAIRCNSVLTAGLTQRREVDSLAFGSCWHRTPLYNRPNCTASAEIFHSGRSCNGGVGGGRADEAAPLSCRTRRSVVPYPVGRVEWWVLRVTVV